MNEFRYNRRTHSIPANQISATVLCTQHIYHTYLIPVRPLYHYKIKFIMNVRLRRPVINRMSRLNENTIAHVEMDPIHATETSSSAAADASADALEVPPPQVPAPAPPAPGNQQIPSPMLQAIH